MKSRLAEDLADIPKLRVSRIYSRNPELSSASSRRRSIFLATRPTSSRPVNSPAFEASDSRPCTDDAPFPKNGVIANFPTPAASGRMNIPKIRRFGTNIAAVPVAMKPSTPPLFVKRNSR
jgi:hypothetical protein